jgi:hypothetical protein
MLYEWVLGGPRERERADKRRDAGMCGAIEQKDNVEEERAVVKFQEPITAKTKDLRVPFLKIYHSNSEPSWDCRVNELCVAARRIC